MEWSSQICHKVINNIDLEKAVWVYEYFLSSEIWFMKSKIEITPRNIQSEKVVCVQVLTNHKQSIFVWECLFVIGLLLRKDIEFKWTAKPSDTSIIKSLLNIWRAHALYKSRWSLLFFILNWQRMIQSYLKGKNKTKNLVTYTCIFHVIWHDNATIAK